MTDDAAQPRPVAWYVVRVAPGMRDHGARLGPWWRVDDAMECVDDRHALVPLYDKAALDAAVAAERERCAMIADHAYSGDGPAATAARLVAVRIRS